MENLCVRYLTGTTLGIPYKFSEQRSPQRFWYVKNTLKKQLIWKISSLFLNNFLFKWIKINDLNNKLLNIIERFSIPWMKKKI